MNKKHFFALSFAVLSLCVLVFPKTSQAYRKDYVSCFSWNDCYRNDSACNGRTLICEDDRPGYRVYCKDTTNPSWRCSMGNGDGSGESGEVIAGCSYQPIQECGYYEVAAPTVDLLVNNSNGPVTISAGESATLSWTSSSPARSHPTCIASGAWSGEKKTSGSEVVSPAQTSEYTLTCTNDGGSVSDKVKVIVAGAGQGTVTPTPPTTTSTPIPTIVPARGDLSVKVRLNGQEVSTPVAVEYQFLGPQTLQGSSAPHTFNNIDANSANSYVGKYISGGPANSKFLGFSSSPVHVVPGKATTVYMDFTDGAGLCNITVQAIKTSCDGSNQYPWTGSLSYGLLGPAILNGLSVNQTFETIPAGRYYLTSLMGGPGTYNGVTPGNPVACPSGGNVTLTMKFRDCGETNYKCNYSTGRCESCALYSNECKYNNASECNMQCAGCTEAHAPVSNIFCWASLDSDTCTGVNDANPDTPPVILYNKSSDNCGDIKGCHWDIYNSQGALVQSADSCAPYPWYDETPGTYTSKLTVTDSQGNHSTDTQKFTVKNIDVLTCNFVWDPTSPTANGITSFFDQTLTPKGTSLKSWSWTFEGATPASSTAQNISSVKFTSAGPKTITLTVKNSADKTCTLSKKIQIKTINPYWKETIPD